MQYPSISRSNISDSKRIPNLRIQLSRPVAFRKLLFILVALLLFSSSGVAATFVVTKVADTNDGVCNTDCSLREAIAAANTVSTDDIVQFDPAVFSVSQTITLVSGWLAITNAGSVSINGPGVNLLTIDGNNTTRVFSISGGPPNEGAFLMISGLTIRRGFFEGGGGAIFNGQSCSVTNSAIIESGGLPGAIYNLGTMTITGTNISASNGIAIYNEDRVLNLIGSTIANSTSGGIHNDRGTVNISNSTLSQNLGNGLRNIEGTVTLDHADVKDNSIVGFNSDGGGILNFSASSTKPAILNISASSITGNSASGEGSEGGGIMNIGGRVSITHSIIAGNKALQGGSGGGISNFSDSLEITNSTLANNTANNSGGAIYNRAELTLTNVTIARNTADFDQNGIGSGGGIFNVFGNPLTAVNTLIGDNVSMSGSAHDLAGVLTSQGHNLIENVSGATINGISNGNILGRDPRLTSLRNYGGAVPTLSLQSDSPAIDAADPTNFPVTDQRGFSRPQDGDLNGTSVPDIGAYETDFNVLTVTKTADTNDGVCNSDCSLREAIAVSNAAAPGDHAVQFSPAVFSNQQTIQLALGQLQLNHLGTLLIAGSGRNLLTLSGNDISRIFFNSTSASTVIRDLSMTRGRAQANNGGAVHNGPANLSLIDTNISLSTSSNGGAINNEGGKLRIAGSIITGNTSTTHGGAVSTGALGQSISELEIVNSMIDGNTALSGGGGVTNSFGLVTITNSGFHNNSVTGSSNSGGAINSIAGSVRVTESSFSGNTATDGGGAIRVQSSDGSLFIADSSFDNNSAPFGGGVRFDGGTVVVSNSTFRLNSAVGRGGGMLTNGGTATITGSTFYENSANDDGGGLANFASLTLSNSTFSGNIAVDTGGGFYNGSTAAASHVTIVKNRAAVGGGGANRGSLSIRSALIGDNVATNTAVDFSGSIDSLGYNLIENSGGTTINGTLTGNITGQDPRIGLLGDNGGNVLTHALMAGSPAIDTADPSTFPNSDQRGYSRPRDGDGNGTVRADIGAFELRSVLVTNTLDSGSGSLRQALADAPMQDAVVFRADPFGTPRTVSLTTGELVIPSGSNFYIAGPGANNLTISGNNQSRVFFVSEGSNVTIGGITITGGNGVGAINNGHDGGVSNWGTLTMVDSIVRNNSANGNGGGIGSNPNSVLTIVNSTIRQNRANTVAGGGLFVQNSSAAVIKSAVTYNSAAGVGGGIANIFGTLNLAESTIANNAAGNGGGGVSNFSASSVMAVTNSTISGNSTASNSGGGVNNATGGNATIGNTIIADNTGDSADFSGTLGSLGFNLIENTLGTIILGVTDGNILGQDPRLRPLRNYGGSTDTQPLGVGSPAIDKGNSASGTDQRGNPRPFDFPTIPNAAGGNGSDIGAFERQPTDVVKATPFDFDGDGKTDVGIYRPAGGEWWWQRSSDGVVPAVQFGNSTDVIAPGDFTGDGKLDHAFFRPSDGFWHFLRSEDFSYYAFPFGQAGDVPVTGDYDGDGKADVAVFRSGTWYIGRSSDGGTTITGFGVAGDVPVTADYDGDGKDDIGIYRPNGATGGEWWINRTTAGLLAMQFGGATDKTVPGDYTGDGKADIAFWRPTTGEWYIVRSEDSSYYAFPFGQNGDIPAPGDYDGDGKMDAAIFRNGVWYIAGTQSGTQIIGFGVTGDRPISNAFVR